MEARMQPRSDGTQRCLHFGLSTTPASRVMMYQDHDGNIVHHFNIPGRHSRLTLTAEALVECGPRRWCRIDLGRDCWDRLDALTASGEFWDLLNAEHVRAPDAAPRGASREIASSAAPIRWRCCRLLTTEIYDGSSTARRARASIRRSTMRCRRARACARTSRTS